ncbi:alpha/beta hydrolase [Actinosynnema sp. NPDC020468]|uniref:alpha/beta hydrolase n=1 Tax=Actinosynnema sp. NPDC020468 TaxID=3154488 RepID=UPI0033FF7E33
MTGMPPAPRFFAPPPAEPTPDGHDRYRDVGYAVVPGFRPLTLDLTVPRVSGPVPVVVWIHGGAWLGGSHLHVGSPPWVRRAAGLVLDAGMAFASVQYRLSGETPFPGQLHDVKAAVRWLRRFGGPLGLDTDRIGAWGESAGGHLAALLALTGADAESEGGNGVTEGTGEVRAVVDFYGPADLATMGHDEPTSPESLLLGGPVPERVREARSASPVTHVRPDAPPLLLVHGEQDRVVPFAQSRALADALVAVGASVELVPVPGADHVLLGVDPNPVVDLAVAFLDRALRA